MIATAAIERSDMGSTYVVKEESTDPAKKRSVHGRDGATQERPLRSTEMWYGGVRVVEESHHDDPVIHELFELGQSYVVVDDF